MKFSNKIYNKLKFVVQILLPALAAFYLGLGQVWEFPETEKVVTSIALLATFLGVLLQISTSQYNSDVVDGAGVISPNGSVDPDTGIPGIALTVNKPVEEILAAKEVKLKVSDIPPEILSQPRVDN